MTIMDVCEQNEDLPLEVIKKNILDEYFNGAYNELIDKQRKINEIEANKSEMKDRLTKFKTQAVTFNQQKCHGCQRTLDLPAIHFLCMHSFHYDEACMQNVEDACYECQPEAQKINGIRADADVPINDETFFKDVGSSPQCFIKICRDYIGKGALK